MGAVRGAVVGGFGLVTLYNLSTATGTAAGAAGVTTLFGLPGRLAHWLISPDVPLIPDRAGVGLSGTVSGSLAAPPSSSSGTSSGVIHN